jgi:hypothetical protein
VLQKHLLKYKYQPQRISSSWIGTISEQRSEIESALSVMPSLRPTVEQILDEDFGPGENEKAAET